MRLIPLDVSVLGKLSYLPYLLESLWYILGFYSTLPVIEGNIGASSDTEYRCGEMGTEGLVTHS
jgi:hypothetical protein